MPSPPIDPALAGRTVAYLLTRIEDAERTASELREVSEQLRSEGDFEGARVVLARASAFDRRAWVLRRALAPI